MMVALMASVYARIDLILIGHFLPYGQVGIYSAAWKIVEALAFFPVLVLAAMAPILSEYHKQSISLFTDKLGSAFRWLFWGTFSCVIVALFGVEMFMVRLFGDAYKDAIPVFEIMVWVLMPMLFNLFVTQAAIHHGKLRFLAESSFVGLFFGLVLGCFLIPRWGLYGAAWSTLLSHIFAYVIFGWLRPSARELLGFQWRVVAR